jgi:hypothetical protein
MIDAANFATTRNEATSNADIEWGHAYEPDQVHQGCDESTEATLNVEISKCDNVIDIRDHQCWDLAGKERSYRERRSSDARVAV